MVTQQNYNRLLTLVRQSSYASINDYFLQILDLAGQGTYNMSQILQACVKQIGVANRVIETGEQFSEQTAQGPITVIPEEAEDTLDDGLMLLISVLVFSHYAGYEDIVDNYRNIEIIAQAAGYYQLALTDTNVEIARGFNPDILVDEEAPEEPEEPEVLQQDDDLLDDDEFAELDAIINAPINDDYDDYDDYDDESAYFINRFPEFKEIQQDQNRNYKDTLVAYSDMLFKLFDLVNKHETALNKILIGKYDIKSQSDRYPFELALLSQDDSIIVTNIVADFSKVQMRINKRALAVACKILYTFYSFENWLRYIVIPIKATDPEVFDLWFGSSVPDRSKTAVALRNLRTVVVALLLIYKAENKLEEFFKDMDITKDLALANQLYENYMDACATYAAELDVEQTDQVIEAAKDISEKFSVQLSARIELAAIRVNFKNEEQALKQYTDVKFKGW